MNIEELKFEKELLFKKMKNNKENLTEYTNSFINDKLKIIEKMPDTFEQINEISKLFYYDPGCFYLYFLIGSLYEKLENEKAIEKKPGQWLELSKSYYMQSIYHSPNFADAYLKLALVYKMAADKNSYQHVPKHANGICLLESAIKKFPTDYRIKNSLGVLYIESSMYKKATDTMLEIINDKTVDVGIKIDVLHNTGTFTLDNYKAIEYLNESEKLLFENKCKHQDTSYMNISTLQNKLLRLNRVYVRDIIKNNNGNNNGNGSNGGNNNTVDELDYLYKQHTKINYLFKDVPVMNHTRHTNEKVKVKIGYLSSDFKNHVITKYIYGPIKAHNRKKFEIFLYYNGIYTGSENEKTTMEFKKLDLTFREIKEMSDESVAQMIFSDKIDILIDLNGHTEGNRMGVFARKPAPIQITYLGYPNTTGLKTMDYRITDIYADPIDTKQLYSEKLLRLSRSFLCYDPNDVKSDISGKFVSNGEIDLPINARENLSREITLASINKITKNSRQTINTWIKIMKRLPNAKLLVKLDPDEMFMEEFYTKEFDKRVKILKIPMEKRKFNATYYNIFNDVDILLDPFPYTGTTTSCDSLYMVTPIITFSKKNYHVHNVTASILKHMGNEELIAYSEEEYVEKCVDLANNPERITEYKKTLRKKLLETMSIDKFMVEYEALLENLVNIRE
jgi:predicted O-linked N-acetylglucosamine transferase (SPINDLY family)